MSTTPLAAGSPKPVAAGSAKPVVAGATYTFNPSSRGDRRTMAGRPVELVIRADIIMPEVTDLVIAFFGDICAARRYAGDPTHSMTCLVMDNDEINIGMQCLAVEVDAWRYRVPLDQWARARDHTGWACDLCEDNRGAHFRASVCYLDLLLYKKRICLPNTVMVHALIRRTSRLENKDICEKCRDFVYTDGISPINPRRGLRSRPED